MNKKQWIVLGIGLIVMGFFFGMYSNNRITRCHELVEDSIDRMLTVDISRVEQASSDTQTLINTCFIKPEIIGVIGTIFLGLGTIFIILGFLEDKKMRS